MRWFISFALLVMLAGSATFADAPAAKVVFFKAYDAHGNLAAGLKVVAHQKGQCQGSLSTVRPDAWRCFTTEDWIHDPCFSASPSAKELVCPDDYFHHTVYVVTMKSPLEPPGGENAEVVKQLRPPDIEPWALALSNGGTCVFTSGATFTLKNRRANYPCSKGGWVTGYPEKAKPGHWIIHMADDHGNPAGTLAVTTAVL
jgi:hypothetical protein